MKKKSLYRYSDGGKIDPPIKGKPIILADPNKPYDKITNPDGYKVTRFPGDTLTNNQIVKVAEDLWTKGENYNSLSNKTLVQNGVGNVYPLSNIDIPKVKKAFDNMGWFGRTWNAMTPYSPKNTTIPQPQYEMGGKTDPPVKRKPIITTNPNDPRLKAYSDSLKTYNYTQGFNNLMENYKDSDYSNALNVYNKVSGGAPLKYNSHNTTTTKKTSGNTTENITYAHADFPKPVQPIVYKKPAPINDYEIFGAEEEPIKPKPIVYPIHKVEGAQKGSVKIQQGKQATIPEPTGQPVYGPSNGLIGYQTSEGFKPTLRRDHLAKVNQADIDLLNNPEALKKYAKETPRYDTGGFTDDPIYRYNKKQDLIRNPRLPLQDSINPNILQQYQNRTQIMFHPEQDFNDELQAAQLPSNQVSNGASIQVGRQFGATNRTNIGLFGVLDPLAREISEKFDRNKQDDEYTKIMYNSRFNTPVLGESENVKHGYKLYRYGGKTKPKILKFEDGGEIDALEKELEDSLFQEDAVVKNDKMVVEDTPQAPEQSIDEDDNFMEDILYAYSNRKKSRSSNSEPIDNQSIDSAAEQYNIPANILYGVWGAESGFGKVGTTKENSAGAQGHFQFTKATADHFGLKNRGNFNEEAPIAAKYLSQLKQKFGNWEDALRGYNAGPGKVKQSYKFKETNNYVQKVKQYAAQYK